MKKALVVLSICAVIAPTVYADINPDTTVTVHKKSKKHHVASKPAPAKPAAPTPAVTETKADEVDYPLLKDISGNMAFVTNYMFRGVSQSRNLPAVQGSLTYTTPIAIYFNLWGSNASFVGTNASVEFDTIVGYHNTYGDNFAFDLSVGRYNYPGARILNYNEFNAVANLYFVQAAFAYSANVYNTHQTGIYYNGGIVYDLPAKWALGIDGLNLQALMGHYSLPRAAGNSYNDYSIQLSKTFKIYKVAALWTNTNGRQHNAPYDSNQIVGLITASF